MTRPDDRPATAEGRAQPTWLAEGCPAWCVREHDEADHPEDRYHRSEPSPVPGAVAVRSTIPLNATIEELALVTWTGRYVGETDEWVVIEPVEQREPRLVVSVETARGLVRGLAEQLARHEED